MLGFSLSVLLSLSLMKFWGESLIFLMVLTAMMLMWSCDFGASKVGALFELDSVSWSLIILSLWVVILAVMASLSVNQMNQSSDLFMFTSMSLLLALLSSFALNDYLLFYLSFETSLIPVFVLILGWGYQPERVQAGIYMLFYTVTASLPLLVMLLVTKISGGSGYMHMLSHTGDYSVMYYFFFLAAFLVKFPMYIVHLWLPKAHVEAPVAGSMLLAGVLLKLGGYGMVRVLSLLGGLPSVISSMLVSLSLWGGFMVSISCLRLMDMKSLIACSSVVHMSGCIGSLVIMSEWGLKGAVCLMVAHGLCSSGLFYLTYVVYSRTHSRSMLVSKGLLNIMPSISLWWFLLLSVNMAAPPSLNLLGELSIIIGLVSWSKLSVVMLGLMSFFSAAYSLYLYSLSQHGQYLFSKGGLHSGYMVEYLILVLHWAPVNFLILNSSYILS
uniref:NADH-ubiquinone oxidoreductase chain 4 n=1 Tax=Stygobromus allegheniensis TaxID=1677011 RepID=A0A6C0X7V6_9CRUS|nr:NADH dehydrogenase subunit 4 [Stygobromus allegheniensis]QIC54426.1 NADH dehydrogenase subunit 4 [Stygobromus allegheniensis]